MDIEIVAKHYKEYLKRLADRIAQLRKDRVRHPLGKFDKRGRWYPSKLERQSCCQYVRRPSASYPKSLNTHCRSKKHVYNLLGVHTIHA